MKSETVGAKIRNRLSPYNTLIQMVEMGDDDEALKYLKERIEVHRKCCDELQALSKECEIEPSDRWDKHGD